MVRALYVCILLSVMLVACSADEECSKATELQPALCRIKLPKISSITILENAAVASASRDEKPDCSDFKLSKMDVDRYFEYALKTDPNDAQHSLDWSPCYAGGTLVFSDGRKAHWSINQFRTGSLSIDEGNRISLYCPNCTFKPFKW